MTKKSIVLLLIFLCMGLCLAGCLQNKDKPIPPPIESKSSMQEDKNTVADEAEQPVGEQEDNEEISTSPGKIISEPETADGKKVTAEDNASSASNSNTNQAPEKTTEGVRLVVTHNYGTEVVFDSFLDLTGVCSALELTEMNLEVESSYGGSFVNSINGKISGYTEKKGGERKKEDWFLYYNGNLAAAGAGDITIKQGDTVWWDYHDWGLSAFTPAMIGAFPQPLSRGVTLFYSQSCQDRAIKMADILKNRAVNVVDIQEYDEKTVNQRSTCGMLIGIWNELNESSMLKGLSQNNKKTGLFCKLGDNGFQRLSVSLQETGTVYRDSTAIIAAAGRGLGDQYPLWLLVGYDAGGLDKAIDFLAGNSIAPQYGWGILISPAGIESIPAECEK